MAEEKKGITVKIDAALHAEIRQFIEQNGMTMADFVSQALYNELHPKIQPQEVKNMGPTRTMAFKMPEDMLQNYLLNLTLNFSKAPFITTKKSFISFSSIAPREQRRKVLVVLILPG